MFRNKGRTLGLVAHKWCHAQQTSVDRAWLQGAATWRIKLSDSTAITRVFRNFHDDSCQKQ